MYILSYLDIALLGVLLGVGKKKDKDTLRNNSTFFF